MATTYALAIFQEPIEIVAGKKFSWGFKIAPEGVVQSLDDILAAEVQVDVSGENVVWSMTDGQITKTVDGDDDMLLLEVDVAGTTVLPQGSFPFLLSIGVVADEPDDPVAEGSYTVKWKV